MIREEAGRLVVGCDHCPVRLDLGPVHTARARNRTPSGWISAAGDRHFCPRCAPAETVALMASNAARGRPQPLLPG